MIDVALFYRLMDALPDTARLICWATRTGWLQEAEVCWGFVSNAGATQRLVGDKVDLSIFSEAGEEQFRGLAGEGAANALNGHVVQLKYSTLSGDRGLVCGAAIIHNRVMLSRRFWPRSDGRVN